MQDGESATTQPPIAALPVFGIPQGSKVLLGRAMKDFIFNIVASKAPAVGSAMRAMDQQIATVAIANDDNVAIVLDQSVTLPAAANNPAATYYNVTVSLSRSAQGLFDFAISAATNTAGAQPLSYLAEGLSAQSQSGGAYVFSAGAEPRLNITPASGPSGVALIEAYTAPYLQGQPAAVRMFAPSTVGLVTLSRLPDAPSSSPDQQSDAGN